MKNQTSYEIMNKDTLTYASAPKELQMRKSNTADRSTQAGGNPVALGAMLATPVKRNQANGRGCRVDAAAAVEVAQVNILGKYRVGVNFVALVKKAVDELGGHLIPGIAYDTADLMDDTVWAGWTAAEKRLAGLCLKHATGQEGGPLLAVKCCLCSGTHFYVGVGREGEHQWCSKEPVGSDVEGERHGI
jgi:hypothetical protein